MKRFLLIMTLLVIAGCATTDKTTVRNGKKGLHINCSGLSSSWGRCYSKAAASCSSRGYKVVARSGDTDEEEGDFLFGMNPAGYTSRSMIVICK
ncbi:MULTISPECIES: hypothetical protein [Pseudomonas]|uniref:hypothetical protein n=1 Tax=Pseudomonas TaxID=286 RepID=UPI0009B81DD7|nr:MULTISPECIES: hypothetical protein [Pseudomonas]QUN69232.1 hypothetical protein KDB76_07960 [Pseudomonas sp. JS425]WJM54998.1 hypothetical protein QUC26_07480 [Pseudomonas asiatica]